MVPRRFTFRFLFSLSVHEICLVCVFLGSFFYNTASAHISGGECSREVRLYFHGARLAGFFNIGLHTYPWRLNSFHFSFGAWS